MKFYTSYFYAVRFFDKNIIPMSTALSDPKWFHNNKSQDYWYLDKNEVINGLRIPPFVPEPQCEDLCSGRQNCGNGDPSCCAFLKTYADQLDKLDAEDMMSRFAAFAQIYKKDFNIDGEISFALLFHEAPNNPCSERWPVQNWFRKNGIECKEFRFPRKNKI